MRQETVNFELVHQNNVNGSVQVCGTSVHIYFAVTNLHANSAAQKLNAVAFTEPASGPCERGSALAAIVHYTQYTVCLYCSY